MAVSTLENNVDCRTTLLLRSRDASDEFALRDPNEDDLDKRSPKTSDSDSKSALSCDPGPCSLSSTDPYFIADLWDSVRVANNMATGPVYPSLSSATTDTFDYKHFNQARCTTFIDHGADQSLYKAFPGREAGARLSNSPDHFSVWVSESEKFHRTVQKVFQAIEEDGVAPIGQRIAFMLSCLFKSGYGYYATDINSDSEARSVILGMRRFISPKLFMRSGSSKMELKGSGIGYYPPSIGAQSKLPSKQSTALTKATDAKDPIYNPDFVYCVTTDGFSDEVANHACNHLPILGKIAHSPYLTGQWGQYPERLAAFAAAALYNRWRLHRLALSPTDKELVAEGDRKSFEQRTEQAKEEDKTIRHFAIHLTGSKWTLWQLEPKDMEVWKGCRMMKVRSGDCTVVAQVKQLCRAINLIHDWGLVDYAASCKNDVTLCHLGGGGDPEGISIIEQAG